MSNLIEVRVPDIGDSTDVEVIEILVNVGDTVALEDSLVSLESDKASMEIPSPAAGTVTKVLVKPGDKVSTGSDILVMAVDDAAAMLYAAESAADVEAILAELNITAAELMAEIE